MFRKRIIHNPAARPSTKEEAEDQLLIYSARFLPSPIFNMERLMPTNREAQEKYLPFPLHEKKPQPPSVMPEPPSVTPEPPSVMPKPLSVTPEQLNEEEIAEPMEVTDQEENEKKDTKKTPEQRNEVVISEPMKYREVKDLEEDEKEDTKKKEKRGSGAKRRMVQNTTTSIQNQPAQLSRSEPASKETTRSEPAGTESTTSDAPGKETKTSEKASKETTS
ncbi:uncharacterized protein ACNLHF_024775 [Anomaloglossus baeobatrachus]|uniref:uncharacterized protein LOC142246620 n=1 Tax=Anomaloglossus baeobatrachus TaxID=238106 RepID=UPI003F509F87